MRGWLFVATITVLAILAAPAAMATESWWDVTPVGGQNVFTYVFMSTEVNDVLTSVHIYAPINLTDILDWSADEGWLFSSTIDEQTGDIDLCWSAEVPENGLEAMDFLQVSITTSSSLAIDEEYYLQDYIGNWGFNTLNLVGEYPTIMDSSVGVPVNRLTSVPEPASLLAILSGCALLKLRRRK